MTIAALYISSYRVLYRWPPSNIDLELSLDQTKQRTVRLLHNLFTYGKQTCIYRFRKLSYIDRYNKRIVIMVSKEYIFLKNLYNDKELYFVHNTNFIVLSIYIIVYCDHTCSALVFHTLTILSVFGIMYNFTYTSRHFDTSTSAQGNPFVWLRETRRLSFVVRSNSYKRIWNYTKC